MPPFTLPMLMQGMFCLWILVLLSPVDAFLGRRLPGCGQRCLSSRAKQIAPLKPFSIPPMGAKGWTSLRIASALQMSTDSAVDGLGQPLIAQDLAALSLSTAAAAASGPLASTALLTEPIASDNVAGSIQALCLHKAQISPSELQEAAQQLDQLITPQTNPQTILTWIDAIGSLKPFPNPKEMIVGNLHKIFVPGVKLSSGEVNALLTAVTAAGLTYGDLTEPLQGMLLDVIAGAGCDALTIQQLLHLLKVFAVPAFPALPVSLQDMLLNSMYVNLDKFSDRTAPAACLHALGVLGLQVHALSDQQKAKVHLTVLHAIEKAGRANADGMQIALAALVQCNASLALLPAEVRGEIVRGLFAVLPRTPITSIAAVLHLLADLHCTWDSFSDQSLQAVVQKQMIKLTSADLPGMLQALARLQLRWIDVPLAWKIHFDKQLALLQSPAEIVKCFQALAAIGAPWARFTVECRSAAFQALQSAGDELVDQFMRVLQDMDAGSEQMKAFKEAMAMRTVSAGDASGNLTASTSTRATWGEKVSVFRPAIRQTLAKALTDLEYTAAHGKAEEFVIKLRRILTIEDADGLKALQGMLAEIIADINKRVPTEVMVDWFWCLSRLGYQARTPEHKALLDEALLSITSTPQIEMNKLFHRLGFMGFTFGSLPPRAKSVLFEQLDQCGHRAVDILHNLKILETPWMHLPISTREMLKQARATTPREASLVIADYGQLTATLYSVDIERVYNMSILGTEIGDMEQTCTQTAKVVEGLSRMGFRYPHLPANVTTALEAALVHTMTEMTEADLGTVLRALATLNASLPSLQTIIVDAVSLKVANMTMPSLTNALKGMHELGYKLSDLPEVLVETMKERATLFVRLISRNYFKTVCAISVIESLSAMGAKWSELPQALRDGVFKAFTSIKPLPKDVVELFFGLERMGVQHHQIPADVLDVIATSLSSWHMSNAQLRIVLQKMLLMGFDWKTIPNRLKNALFKAIDQMTLRDSTQIASIVHCLSNFGVNWYEIPIVTAHSIQQQLQRMQDMEKHLVNLLINLQQLHVQWTSLEQATRDALLVLLSKAFYINARSIPVLFSCLTKMGVTWEELGKHMNMNTVFQRMPDMDGDQYASTLYSMVTLKGTWNAFPPSVLQAIVDAFATVTLSAGEFSRVVYSMAMLAFDSSEEQWLWKMHRLCVERFAKMQLNGESEKVLRGFAIYFDTLALYPQGQALIAECLGKHPVFDIKAEQTADKFSTIGFAITQALDAEQFGRFSIVHDFKHGGHTMNMAVYRDKELFAFLEISQWDGQQRKRQLKTRTFQAVYPNVPIFSVTENEVKAMGAVAAGKVLVDKILGKTSE